QAEMKNAREIANAELSLKGKAIEASAQNEFLKSQASMADAVGKSASGVIGALFNPTVAAINSAAYENAAAMNSAAIVAASGFQSQADTVGYTSNVTRSISDAVNGWGDVAFGIGSIMAGTKSKTEQITGAVSQAAAAYYTGGASLAMQG